MAVLSSQIKDLKLFFGEGMKKATNKTTQSAPALARSTPTAVPTRLGTKRGCPKCGTKFYDFEKTEIHCPKCNTEIDVNANIPPPKPAPEPRKKVSETDAAAEALSTDEVQLEGGDNIMESVEDLADSEDDIQEVDGGDEKEEDY